MDQIKRTFGSGILPYIQEHIIHSIQHLDNINTQDSNGDTVLNYAIRASGRIDKIVEVIRYILSLGIDVNTINHNGFTPLMEAIRHKSSFPIITEMLINAGADVSKSGLSTQLNPLIIAIIRNNLDICKLLVYNGAKVTIDMIELPTSEKIKELLQNEYNKMMIMLVAHTYRNPKGLLKKDFLRELQKYLDN